MKGNNIVIAGLWAGFVRFCGVTWGEGSEGSVAQDLHSN